jgi:hypothetical protein
MQEHDGARQSTPVHARARQFTPEHASARQSTSMHARARQCTPEHASARQSTPIDTRARQSTPEHASARQCTTEHANSHQSTPVMPRGADCYALACLCSTEAEPLCIQLRLITARGSAHMTRYNIFPFQHNKKKMGNVEIRN